jgi:hypothetical protein
MLDRKSVGMRRLAWGLFLLALLLDTFYNFSERKNILSISLLQIGLILVSLPICYETFELSNLVKKTLAIVGVLSLFFSIVVRVFSA